MSSQWNVVRFLVGQRTSTGERIVKLVTDALEDDRRTPCEELSRAMGAKTSQENAQEPTSVAHGWATHAI